MKKIIATSALIGLGMINVRIVLAEQIYTCVVNGKVVYTSHHEGKCSAVELAPISRYPRHKEQKREDKRLPTEKTAQQALESNRVQKQNQPLSAVESINQAAAKKRAASDKSIVPSPLPQEDKTITASPLPSDSTDQPDNTRPDNRIEILEKKLAEEREALAKALQLLTYARMEQTKSFENQQQVILLQNSVRRHRQNIQILQQDIKNLE